MDSGPALITNSRTQGPPGGLHLGKGISGRGVFLHALGFLGPASFASRTLPARQSRLPFTTLGPMANESSERSPLDALWDEYGQVFREFDDLTLARWLAQTLGQLQGRAWRMSHPLVAAYRLAAQEAHRRGVWLKRLATPPTAYLEAPCCRAPALPVLTRDVRDAGLLCQHCNETLVPFEEIPEEIRPDLELWAAQYAPVHGVAHWDDRQRKAVGHYDRALDQAAEEAERLLIRAGRDLAPRLLDHYPAIIWEDQDECLDVRPEDVILEPGH